MQSCLASLFRSPFTKDSMLCLFRSDSVTFIDGSPCGGVIGASATEVLRRFPPSNATGRHNARHTRTPKPRDDSSEKRKRRSKRRRDRGMPRIAHSTRRPRRRRRLALFVISCAAAPADFWTKQRRRDSQSQSQSESESKSKSESESKGRSAGKERRLKSDVQNDLFRNRAFLNGGSFSGFALSPCRRRPSKAVRAQRVPLDINCVR
eukprot:scaffold247_cov274-Pinguiococcus_pyrenoidosus.AAC.6